MRIARRILIGLVIVAGCIAALSTPSPTATKAAVALQAGQSNDAFHCYYASGTAPNKVVDLADQFGGENGDNTTTVGSPYAFCDQATITADQCANGITDNNTDPLTSYLIKQTEPFFPLTADKPIVRVRVTDDAGIPCIIQDMRIRAPHSLLVPSQKNGEPTIQQTNHFRCYTVTPGRFNDATGGFTTGFDNVTGNIYGFDDQFLSRTNVALQRTLYLCAPVNKDFEGCNPFINPDHLLCAAVPSVIFRSRLITVTNQFFPNGTRLRLRIPFMTCLPARKECLNGRCFGDDCGRLTP